MDLTIRNARFLEANALRVADIGIAGGSIVAIESGLKTDAREIDASGCLVVPGMIETHIHLDKTCILDRCRIEEGDRRRSGQADFKRKTRFHRR